MEIEDSFIVGIDIGSKDGDNSCVTTMCGSCKSILSIDRYNDEHYYYIRPSKCKKCGAKFENVVEMK